MVKGNLRKSLIENMDGRKFSNWECLLRFIVKKDYSYLCMWMTNIGWKEHNIVPMWKVLNKEVDLGEPTSFLGSCILGMHSKTMRNKQRSCGQLQNHV